MDPLVYKVLNRVAMERLGAALGDPKAILSDFEDYVESSFSVLSKDIPTCRIIQERMKELPSNPMGWETRDHEDRHFLEMRIATMRAKLGIYFDWLRRKGAGDLFLSILQIYELPAAVRKKIEVCSRFWAKSRVNAPKRGMEIEAYAETLTMLRAQIDVAKEAIRVGKEPSAEGSDGTIRKLRAGSFELNNTGGFPTAEVEATAEVVEKAEKLLRDVGLGKVCYGEVQLSNQVARAKTLAFYDPSADEMFVRVDKRVKAYDLLETFVHELGHRLHFKFLKSKEREIRTLYRQIQNLSEKNFEDALSQITPSAGDTFPYKGDTLVVESVDGFRRQVKMVLQGEEKTSPKFTIPLEAYARTKGLLPTGMIGFVTPYAKKNHEENFAEMLAFYAMGKLSPAHIELFEPLLK